MAEIANDCGGARLESKYVHSVYAKTAHRLSKYPHRAWPRVQEFIDSLEPYSLLADIGKHYVACSAIRNKVFSSLVLFHLLSFSKMLGIRYIKKLYFLT